MTRHVPLFLLACAALACGSPEDAELGTLSLALDAHAGGQDYRLIDARFALAGPETKTFLAEDDGAVGLELSPGNYTLTLLEDWTLTQLGAEGPDPVKAKLVSANPIPLVITPGQTTTATLRFELEGGAPVPLGNGALDVQLDVVPSSASEEACASALRVNEVDYDQAGNDAAEFVELLNVGECELDLHDVALELVNGGDGKVYGRYMLAEAAPSLPARGRLLVADQALLDALSFTGPKLALRSAGLQNGPDGVRVVRGERVLEALAYGGPVSGASEGDPAPKDDGEKALARCPEGFDSDVNFADFALQAPSPGAPNPCQ